MELLQKAKMILEERPICSHCLGRQFAILGFNISNECRGDAIKLLLTLEGHRLTLSREGVARSKGIKLLRHLAENGQFTKANKILKNFCEYTGKKKPCYICAGKFAVIDDLVSKVTKKLKEVEYSTFLIGIELPLKIAECEEEFKSRFNITHGESIKNEFSREIGKRIVNLTGKEVNFTTPSLVAIVNPFSNKVVLQINPLFIAGRYNKLVIGIPQSRWLCNKCNGVGCIDCKWTGKSYQDSIEELIGIPALQMTDGKDFAFHGAGREDVDVRMLGTGRPFVLEVKEPRKRFIELKELKRKINRSRKVKVRNLRLADKDTVKHIKKAERTQKKYRSIIEFEREITNEEIFLLENSFSNTTIHQQTPSRVLHRRADLMREKYIYSTKIKRLSQNKVEMQIYCQGGLYIKELIAGDNGRTRPSIAGILYTEAKAVQLDVLYVASGDPD